MAIYSKKLEPEELDILKICEFSGTRLQVLKIVTVLKLQGQLERFAELNRFNPV